MMTLALPLCRLLCGTLLAGLPLAAMACDDAEALRQAAWPQLPAGVLPVEGRFHDADSMACRDWPAQPGTTLLAVAQWTDAASEDVRSGDLDLLLVDTASGQPLAWTRIDGAVSSDAMRFTGLALDTARWQLDADTRAFGVRMIYSGSSGPNPFGQTELRLIVRNGTQLRQVLAPMVVAGNSGEWDTRCAGAFSRYQRTVDIGKGNGQHFAPLIVREKRIDSTSVAHGDDCQQTETAAPARRWTVSAEGGDYLVPPVLQGF